MNIKTITKKVDFKGKKVLVRTDFNVPFDKNGLISDNSRIVKSMKTIKYLQKKGAKIIIITHIGRPDGIQTKDLSTKKLIKEISRLSKTKVKYINEVIGEKVIKTINKLKNSEILVLENIRFYKEEEKCDKEFTKKIAQLGDIYINEAFSASHRKHASIFGIAKILPSYAGFLLESEIKNLEKAFPKAKKKGLTLILGGSKIDTKIGLIKNFINKAQNILVGGAIANTFLKAKNFETGKSLIEDEKTKIAKEIIKIAKSSNTLLSLPIDFTTTNEIKENTKIKNKLSNNIEKNEIIVDIGNRTIKTYTKIIKNSKTIILNGPMGIYEINEFSNGTKKIFLEIAKNDNAIKIIGGGDSISAIKKLKISQKKFTHISTGGGASIEFLEGKSLPGIKVLEIN